MTNVYQLFKPGRAIPDHYKDPCITMENNRLVVTPYGLASLGPYARKIGINLAIDALCGWNQTSRGSFDVGCRVAGAPRGERETRDF